MGAATEGYPRVKCELRKEVNGALGKSSHFRWERILVSRLQTAGSFVDAGGSFGTFKASGGVNLAYEFGGAAGLFRQQVAGTWKETMT